MSCALWYIFHYLQWININSPAVIISPTFSIKLQEPHAAVAKPIESFTNVLEAVSPEKDSNDEDSYSFDMDSYDMDSYDEEYEYDGDEPPELEVGDVSYAAAFRGRRNQCFRHTRNLKFFRNHRSFNFRLQGSHNRKCADHHKQLYEYGQFRHVGSFDSCAKTCVDRVPNSALNHFRGIDFNCNAKLCNCLFDKGTLNNRNSRGFNNVVTRNLNGRGRARNLRHANNFVCGSVH